MALRSDIPLLAQTNVNLSGAAEGFGQGVQIRTMLDKLNAERELKPIRKQLLETQAQQAQQTVSANDIKLAEAEEERQLLSMATGAMEVLPFLTGDSIDIQSAVDVVDQRSQRLLSEGRADVSDTAAVADALESGDPQRIQQVVKQMQSIVDIAEARGVLEASGSKQGLASAKTEIYDNGTIVTQLPDRSTQVTNPEGKIVTGEERVEVLKKAREEEISFAGLKAQATAKGKGAGEFEVSPLVAKAKSTIASAVTLAQAEAKERGEVMTDLSRARAALPGLKEVVQKLKDLAPLATSTIGGKVWDSVVKETGFGATKGSTARIRFSSIIDNQVLPLLKPTFGAAFTVTEGDALRATMGDPDESPANKVAAVEEFIDSKMRDIETKQRQLDQPGAGAQQDLATGKLSPAARKLLEFK